MGCKVLRQALRPLSVTLPRSWKQEAGLQNWVELEEVAKEDDYGDPAERSMCILSVQPQAAIYCRKSQSAYLANFIDYQHGLILPAELLVLRYVPCRIVAVESDIGRRVERYSTDERGRVSACACQEQCIRVIFQPENVLDRMYNARFPRPPFAADILEVLPSPLFLEPRAALVKKHGWQEQRHEL